MTTLNDDDLELVTVPTGFADGPSANRGRGAFAVIRAVLDGYAFRILMATSEAECSAFDLSRRFGIPIVACYRRLRKLEDLGVIAPTRTTSTTAGHPIQLFRSHLRSARIRFEDGRLWAQIEFARPGSDGEPDSRLEETFDTGPAKRKRSRAARDFGYAGAALEFVPHRGEGALNPGEAGG
jgi:winged helix-turn-helix DNA-binding protein